jgi:thiosulfate dehydrogenase
MSARSVITAIAALAGVVIAFAAGFGVRTRTQPPRPLIVQAKAFAPPLDSAIQADDLGKAATLGRMIFTDTARAAPQFVDNDLKCSNCHLDAGRRANAAPLWAAYGMFPQYRAKNGHVNTFAERLQECFKYSMNGKAPPLGDPVLVALESYAAFLARGAPLGARLPGQGYPKLAKPAATPDYARGQTVFKANCAQCHGEGGAGQRSGSQSIFPAVWGARSFNWGAGMADVQNAAAFIAVNMPQDRPGALTNQQAWDVAAYIDSQPRPQDPRYTGSVSDTRRLFHSSGQSAYGTTVNGVLLGGDGPPKKRTTTRAVGGRAVNQASLAG